MDEMAETSSAAAFRSSSLTAAHVYKRKAPSRLAASGGFVTSRDNEKDV